MDNIIPQTIIPKINTAHNKRSYAIGVLVVYQTFQLASRFVTGDTDAAPKSPTAHTADRCTQLAQWQ